MERCCRIDRTFTASPRTRPIPSCRRVQPRAIFKPSARCLPKPNRWAQLGTQTAWRAHSYSTEIAEQVQREPEPIVPRRPFDAPSDQPGSPYFSTPLCGRPAPLGAHVDHETGSINFAITSSGATSISLVLFKEHDLHEGRSTIEIELNRDFNKTGDVWHIALPSVDSNLLYGYRMWGLHQEVEQEPEPEPEPEPEDSSETDVGAGEMGQSVDGTIEIDNSLSSMDSEDPPEDVSTGHRFDNSCVVLDPYGKSVISRRQFGQLAYDLDYLNENVLGASNTWPQSACSMPDPSREGFNWEGVSSPNIPLQDLIIYEMHVRGFTKDHSSGVHAPGTYEGMVQKLDYLQDLGVNCIELLPIHEFNELEYYEVIPGSDNYRFNYWGYSTVNFFSPMSRYSAAISRGGRGEDLIFEMKNLVKECHKRGIEVILDVVFNHTAEGNHLGPTISFRGIDNRVYYMLAPGGEYYNYSGCGNTFNCNRPTVRQFIVDCLKYWVEEMHIDGFRFDLASILTRAPSAWHQGEMGANGVLNPPHSVGAVVDENGYMTDGAGVPTGTPLADPTVIEMISEDPVLRNTKLIAEAWDADGLNQVGAFPHYGGRWAEWNGHFRDVIRNFIKGTDGAWAGDFASAFCGSPNVYQSADGEESTWWKQNDGGKWCGGRGPMHSVNFVTAHDGFTLADLVTYNERRNTANGENNNDGEKNNHSWNCGVEGRTSDPAIESLRRRQMRNFICALTLAHGVPMLHMGDEYGHSKEGNNNTYCHDSILNWFDWNLARNERGDMYRFVRSLLHIRRSRSELRRSNFISGDEIHWHGEEPCKPDWSEQSRLVALTLPNNQVGGGLYIAFNTAHTATIVTLPNWEGYTWDLVVDTSAESPFNALMEDEHLSARDIELVKLGKAPWLNGRIYPLLPYSCIVLVAKPSSGGAPPGPPRDNCDISTNPPMMHGY
ncbi:hypothetical protein BSKO_03554 [Bryopsis sp. KO-2023]|nr:hypothetical protein BSKO_03554 [Bryopsis sp. KO-2023]